MKKEGKPSTDYSDALAITFAFPISGKRRDKEFSWSNYSGMAEIEFNPLVG